MTIIITYALRHWTLYLYCGTVVVLDNTDISDMAVNSTSTGHGGPIITLYFKGRHNTPVAFSTNYEFCKSSLSARRFLKVT